MIYAFIRKGITCVLMMFLLAGGMFAQQQKRFSLDDLPHSPYAGPQVYGYGSAEDEFGLVLPATLAGLLGGSPSLLLPLLGAQDSSILLPGPILHPSAPSPGYYMDAFSSNHRDYRPDNSPYIRLRFSVDRATGGLDTLPGAATYRQAALNQQPADIFLSDKIFRHPGFFPPAPAATPGTNTLQRDDAFFNLVTGWTYTNSTTAAPLIAMGSHDNIDGYNQLPPGELVGNLYFSAHAAENVSPPCSGLNPNDIYCLSHVGVLTHFASAQSMGLLGGDSIDALVVWDMNDNGYWDSSGPEGADYALFSLAPGSPTLSIGGWDGGTVFWTNFLPAPWGPRGVFAHSCNLGVGTFPSPPLLGTTGTPNIDALEIKPFAAIQEEEPEEPIH